MNKAVEGVEGRRTTPEYSMYDLFMLGSVGTRILGCCRAGACLGCLVFRAVQRAGAGSALYFEQPKTSTEPCLAVRVPSYQSGYGMRPNKHSVQKSMSDPSD